MNTSPADPWGKLQAFMQRQPLLAYFFLAYAFSWVLTIPLLLSTWNVIPGDYTLGLYLKQWVGPALAAIIMIRVTEGKAGLLRLRQRIRQWRAGWRWYLFTLLGIPALALVGILIVRPGALASLKSLDASVLANYPLYFVGIFLGTGLPEEIGWRGFALPRMQQRHGPLASSVLLGTLWAFWHLLSFLLPAHGGGPGANLAASLINFAVFLVMVVALTIVITWVYNHTQGSLFIASLVHTAVDAPQLVWAPLFLEVGAANSTAGELGLNLAYLIAFGALAVMVLGLTHGRLGYEPRQEQPIGAGELRSQPAH
jgi:membrane protease YdiL (CAAX protease family)